MNSTNENNKPIDAKITKIKKMGFIGKIKKMIEGVDEKRHARKQWKERHPITNLCINMFYGVCMIIFVGFGYILTTAPDAMKNMASYWTTQNEVAHKLEESIMKRIEEIKNPGLDGIQITDHDGIKIITFKELNPTEEQHQFIITEWVQKHNSDNNFDAIVFGKIYQGLNGRVLWTDNEGNNETDFELFVIQLKKMNITNAFGFIENPNNVYLPNPFTHHVNGKIKTKYNDGNYYIFHARPTTVISSNNYEIHIKDQVIVKWKTIEGENPFKADGIIATTKKICSTTEKTCKAIKNMIN